MTYELKFMPEALDEWNNLDGSISAPLKKKLAKALENPIVPAAQLSGMPDCYKIKQRGSGYRLVYHVDQGEIIVLVLSVGKRERNRVYKVAKRRLIE
ncbi:type II toxin-antitoxin system mRNA interferase toxin, RelE/StbE family [bacterium endosymbiont of Escarpia laminata]|nr:MAG: type II toxin-antitoxin system mRNA interferase toxin, RelE/StbE family [bacterium endosymbiont of Escarpia laminata]